MDVKPKRENDLVTKTEKSFSNMKHGFKEKVWI